MDHLLTLLRAAAEDTRLRILALAAREDLTVSDYVHVLGQSQPRVSRHLKLLVEAGLLERFREAQFTRFRLVTSGDDAALVREVVRRLAPHPARIAPPPAGGPPGRPRGAAAGTIPSAGPSCARSTSPTARSSVRCPTTCRWARAAC